VTGSLRAMLAVDADGALTSVRAGGLGDRAIEACVENAMTGLRVVPVDGRVRPLNPLKVVVRQVMIVLVIPPLIFRSDGRGLHDMFADTATVTMSTFKELVGNRS
jgi:hypothetical protein